MKNHRKALDEMLARLAEQDALLHGATAAIEPEPDTHEDADILDRIFELRFGAVTRATRAARPTHGFLLRA
jgi:hypothetical protein